MPYHVTSLRKPLICKGIFPFPVFLAVVAIKEPQDKIPVLKPKRHCLGPAKLSVLPS